MSRRRRNAPGMVTIYWRDIPAQITATTPEGTEKVLLHERFQIAIDRAAGVAGLTDTDDYVEQWRREQMPTLGDALAAARSRVEQLEAAFDRERLEALVANGGLEPHAPSSEPEAGNQ